MPEHPPKFLDPVKGEFYRREFLGGKDGEQ